MKKISACLIVKNEKDHIEEVLTSLIGFDEIVVVDTGSTDNTIELAQKYTDKVFTDYLWNDDFAEARNHAMKKCTGDFILSIDADEFLHDGGLEKIRKIAEEAPEDQLTFVVVMYGKDSNQTHFPPRLFRNNAGVEWRGAAHESLFPVQKNMTDIQITYGYSTAHQLDPDRMFRILDKEVTERGNQTSRNLYYLAREHWYRKDWNNAYLLFKNCVEKSTWPPEKSDALLYMSRIAFINQQGDNAREHCLRAIEINPDFKEALVFMAELHFEPWKHKWLRLAEVATNEDVLFKRM